MNRHDHRACRFPPTSGGWWLRLFMTAWFAFCVNYVPVHLACERHLEEVLLQACSADAPSANLTSADHPEHDGHVPHLASDHLVRVAPACSQSMTLEAVAVEPEVALVLAERKHRLFLTERQNPPGQSLHSPSQPRAPPLV